jgi:hypothetical protein
MRILAVMAMGVILFATSARSDDKLLEETVGFAGTVLFLQSQVPALVTARLPCLALAKPPMDQARRPTDTQCFASAH